MSRSSTSFRCCREDAKAAKKARVLRPWRLGAMSSFGWRASVRLKGKTSEVCRKGQTLHVPARPVAAIGPEPGEEIHWVLRSREELTLARQHPSRQRPTNP